MMRTFMALAAAAAFTTCALADKPKALKPANNWAAVVGNNDLAKKAPASGVITDAKEFAALWKAWRATEKVPEVDFKKNIVVVTLSLGGPNRPNISGTLDDKGDLKILAFSTRLGGDGFGYSIAVFPKEGIKSVNGKAITKE
jgi:hypothetical protein